LCSSPGMCSSNVCATSGFQMRTDATTGREGGVRGGGASREHGQRRVRGKGLEGWPGAGGISALTDGLMTNLQVRWGPCPCRTCGCEHSTNLAGFCVFLWCFFAVLSGFRGAGSIEGQGWGRRFGQACVRWRESCSMMFFPPLVPSYPHEAAHEAAQEPRFPRPRLRPFDGILNRQASWRSSFG
jgi:hypothetical protein